MACETSVAAVSLDQQVLKSGAYDLQVLEQRGSDVRRRVASEGSSSQRTVVTAQSYGTELRTEGQRLHLSIFPESSKPVRIRTYLRETPQTTKTDMYKFAPPSSRLQAPNRNKPTQIRHPPRGRHPSEGPTGGGGVQIRVGLEPADIFPERSGRV